LNTVTMLVPADAMSLAGMAAASAVLLPKVVGRFEPFHRTTEPETKPLPVTDNVSAGPPATALFGLIDKIVGFGFPCAQTALARPNHRESATVAARHRPCVALSGTHRSTFARAMHSVNRIWSLLFVASMNAAANRDNGSHVAL
jgi:hypothetical protein